MLSSIKERFVTIKSRLYLSFFLLVMLFLINGVITLEILHKNKNLSTQISSVIDPATQSLIELNKLIIESKMYSTNWVFIRSNKEDKDALLKIHSERYPALKSDLSVLSPKMFNEAVNDSLQKVYTGFDQLIAIQKQIIAQLNKFESYDDPFTRMEMEILVEDEIIPRTAALLTSMNHVLKQEQKIRALANIELEKSSLTLRYALMCLATLVITIGVLLSIYLSGIIVKPIQKMREIIADIGQGKLMKISNYNHKNEIGLMIDSVNSLSENLRASSKFAREIGDSNFSSYFQPLSEDDVLGKSLIAMRDNLRESNHRLNQAQSIAKLGSWSYDPITKETTWSDELFNILGYTCGEIEPGLGNFMDMVEEKDRVKFKDILAKGVDKGVFSLECTLFNKDGSPKHLFIQGKSEQDEHSSVVKIVGIVQDVTTQKKSEQILQQNNIELLKTNKELDKFVYSVSHDLRAPLSSMLGVVQMTEEDCEEGEIKESLGMVKTSILKLDGFIQDILAYSRNARQEVKKEEVKFKEMVNDISNDLKHMPGANGNVKLISHIEQNVVFKTDRSRISIVLNNLVSNAIRYHNPSAANPFVEVAVETNEKVATIMITDNGIGIKKELQQKVFDMFYRVSEDSVGSGLGLYIVKETIEKLNGTIKIESEPGFGTKFLVSIPNCAN